jgi:crotonobetainyl-CoA:carnitine CoA-transferase CaiB-like acyl-CoA transferase
MPAVLDLSRGIAGRYCAQMLVLAGADVTRLSVPDGDTEDVVAARAADYPVEILDRGKQLVALDPATEAGRERLHALLAAADAVIDDGGPGGLAPFGITDAELGRLAPRAVRTRISEFGMDGPHAGWAGSELVNLAAGGLLFLTGTCDRPPVQLAPFQAQFASGLFAAIATQAALYAGQPAEIDISKQEAVTALITPALTEYTYSGVIPAREGTVAGMVRIEHASDRWVYAGPSAPGLADYKTLGAFLEIPELAEERFSTQERRMEHWDEHQALIVPRLRERTAAEWVDAAAEWRLTFGHVQTTAELLDCPVMAERHFFDTLDLEEAPVTAPLAPYLVDGERPLALAQPAAEESSQV